MVVVLMACCLILIALQIKKEKYDIALYSEDYVPVGEVSAELDFTLYSKEEWMEYFGEEDEKVLTQEMLQGIVERLGMSTYIDIQKKRAEAIVTRLEWCSVYDQILDLLDTEHLVKKQKLLLVETIKSDDGCIWLTNEEDYATSFSADYLQCWMTYECYTMEGTCIGIVGTSEDTTLLRNVYITHNDKNELSFLYHGSGYRIETTDINSDITGVCDLEWRRGSLAKVYAKNDTIEGELLSYDENGIEIEGYGRISHEGKLPVYQVYGEVQEKSMSDIVLGNRKAQYVVAGDEVCAVLLKGPAQIENIRVILLAEDGALFRNEVFIKTSTECSVTCGTVQSSVAPETVISIADQKITESGVTCCIEPSEEGGTLYLCDAGGTVIGNPYQGRMEVRYTGEGYTVVNELPLEQYLYAVVPSEMPSSFGMEALKAQAVCARSYAYIQLMKADYAAYGAHIDDSTSYQVYNKSPKTEESVAAVDATADQVMTYQNNVIEAYYFSTSSGYTDDISVWNKVDDGTYGYLKKVCLNQTDDVGILSEEQTFRNYICNTNAGYDSDIKFYRWRAEASFEGREPDIASVLKTRKGIAPESILYYNSDGVTERENLDGIGTLKTIAVTERSESGSVLNLRLTYENGMVDVKTEYNIRRVLGVGLTEIGFADGSKSTMTILPSAFCAVIPVEDGSYVIYGGGYGHGLGMSQNGANGLAKEGKTYQDILQFFYRGIEIQNIVDKNE